VPHFQLVTTDGDALGAFELWDSSDGSIIWRGDAPNLRVVGRIDADDPENFDILIVEDAESDTPGSLGAGRRSERPGRWLSPRRPGPPSRYAAQVSPASGLPDTARRDSTAAS
jgi:hypothetical protein